MGRARKLAAGLFVTACVLAVAEAGARLALPPLPPSLGVPYEADPDVGFRVAAGVRRDGFTTSSLGTRGAEPDSARAGPILVLGDSMTLGAEVRDEETFCALLEAALAPGPQVVNAGCPAYGPAEYAGSLRRLAPKVRPSRVLCMVFLGNDLLDAGKERPYGVIGGALVPSARLEGVGAGGRLLLDLAARARGLGLVRLGRRLAGKPEGLVRSRLPANRVAEPGPVAGRDATGAQPLGMDTPEIRVLVEPGDYARGHERGAPFVAKGWTRLPGLLASLRGACDAAGAELAIAILPLPIAYDRAARLEVARRFGTPPAAIDAERPSREVAAVVGALGIRCIDLTAAFRDAPQPHLLHAPADLHLSRDGHALVARELARAVRSPALPADGR